MLDIRLQSSDSLIVCSLIEYPTNWKLRFTYAMHLHEAEGFHGVKQSAKLAQHSSKIQFR